jgi:arsenate reductase
MAEAIVNASMGDDWEAFSAGTQPTGYIHPKALAVLEEISIEHSGHSKHVDELQEIRFDAVITVCDSAAEECPIWLGDEKKFHHSFPDPVNTDDIHDFRKVRNDIEREITALLEKKC